MDRESLAKVCTETELTVEWHKTWIKLLEYPSAQAALGRLLRTARDKVTNLANADLVTEEGRIATIKEQGLIQGLKQAFELLTEEPEDGPDTTDTDASTSI